VDLELSDEEAALRDNVRAVLAGVCPIAVARAVFDGEALPPEPWDTMVALGWPALAIDESHGGLGLGFVELALVAEELGRAVVPSPLLATTTQFVPAIRELGRAAAAERFLPAVAEGRCHGTVALAEQGQWSAGAVRSTARREGDRWVLDGEKCLVLDGNLADLVVVVARGDAGIGAFVVPAGAMKAIPRRGIDPTLPCTDLHLASVEVGDDMVLAVPGAPGVEALLARATEEATVATAAMTVGACRRIVEMTIDYAKVRVQYDRPIGSFQALKHRMVDMYMAVERATALVYYAALSISEDATDRATAAAAAKAAAGDCQHLVAEDGLQLHGGIGFTWEHDLHLLLKRAKAGDALYGSAIAQRAALGSLLGVRGAVSS
jgi:alkylation response protein AidB-like acyl-CoA dehydrogenase